MPAQPVLTKSAAVKPASANKPVAAKPVATNTATATARPALAAKPAAAKPAATRPLAAAIRPVATKPEAPRQQAKPAATKPATTKPLARVSREVQVSEVTENSARLHWERPEPSSSFFYDLTVTSAHDQSLVLRQNLTVTDRVIGGLLAGQLYHVVVVSYLQSQVRAIYQGSFNTKKTQPPPLQAAHRASSSTINLMVNTEPLFLTKTDICKLSRDAGTCVDFKLLWHYDLESKSCKRFWYGGCGGNENRFHSQEECEKMCSPELTV